jgi:hypothetical protein
MCDKQKSEPGPFDFRQRRPKILDSERPDPSVVRMRFFVAKEAGNVGGTVNFKKCGLDSYDSKTNDADPFNS